MKSFRLKNIKSFTDSEEIELRPITIFVGKNSSGKSAIVRFPVVLKQSFIDDTSNPILLHSEKYVDYGNFKDVVHNQVGDTFSYEISFLSKDIQISEDLFLDQDKIPDFDILTIKFKIQLIDNVIILKQYTLLADEKIIIEISNNKANLFSFYDFDKNEPSFKILKPFFPFDATIYKKVNIQINTNELSWNNFDKDKILPTINWIKSLQLKQLFTEYLDNLIYISSFRSKPERNYRVSESIYDNVGKSGENTAILLYKNSKLLEKVSDWFLISFGYKIKIMSKGSNDFDIKVRHKDKSIDENLMDVGSGISQILPIITQMFFDQLENRSRIFIIEEPEIHLHPNAQVELAELFVEIALKTKSQIVIETHSEHLIRKLQSIVANIDEEFNENNIVIYQTDLDNTGVSTIDKIELNKKGQFLTKWKTGFFDKAYQLSKELIANVSKSGKI